MDYVTEDYEIIHAVGKEEQEVYQIKNRHTEVIEYEDYLLPRTIDTLMEVQARLTEMRTKFNAPAPLVAVGDAHEQGGVH